MHNNEKIVRLSISEVARLFGVSEKTVRRAIAEDKIRYIVVHGRYKLHLASVIKWSQETITVRNKSTHTGIGQYVGQWKIGNKLFTVNPAVVENAKSQNPPPEADPPLAEKYNNHSSNSDSTVDYSTRGGKLPATDGATTDYSLPTTHSPSQSTLF